MHQFFKQAGSTGERPRSTRSFVFARSRRARTAVASHWGGKEESFWGSQERASATVGSERPWDGARPTTGSSQRDRPCHCPGHLQERLLRSAGYLIQCVRSAAAAFF